MTEPKKFEACNIVKYDRRQHQTLQMVTETPGKPFEVIREDLFMYEKKE